MGTAGRSSLRLCWAHLRRLKARRGWGAPCRPGYPRSLGWLLLGTLPRLVSNCQEVGAQVPESLCPRSPGGNEPVATLGQAERGLLAHLRLWLRAGALLVKFLPLLLLYPVTYLDPRVAALWLRLLLKATETSGPTYIKLGQWASTRRDIFSEPFCAVFSRLHVRVTPHPWAHTCRLLQQAFGETWDQVLCFEHLEPVGSGCVAQVYKAHANAAYLGEDSLRTLGALGGSRERFGPSGKGQQPEETLADQSFLERLLLSQVDIVEVDTSPPGHPPKPKHLIPVAVKVLHPGLLAQVHMDLLLMKMGSRALGLLPGIRWLSLPEVVEEFEKLMVQQIDLRYEAQNLEHFQRNFWNISAVRFPTPLRPFISREVLVETYEESVPVSRYQQAAVPVELKRQIARLGIRMLLKMIFVDNFVHADLHPGNILVQGVHHLPRSQESGPPQGDDLARWAEAALPDPQPLRLVLLDAGIVAELQAADLSNFRAVFLAVLMGQGHRVAELILHHARASECGDVEAFKTEMAVLVSQARKNTVTLEKVQVSSLLSSFFKLLMTHKVKLESNFASIVFATMVLEGLGRSLDPQLDLLEAARPFLLGGPAPFP
ncbi:putative aarF domain-containing protein kinase 2 [Tenrec ecaudatus]|uniref:putative aarF domain-containing protein kinase 2 n=1 Tax=Tenrec ecaudatus TaxID=94439 RepID=UPI003F5A824A